MLNIHPVTVVPIFVPKINPIESLKFKIPEFTKLTIKTDTTEED